jgi:hypothetical protein
MIEKQHRRKKMDINEMTIRQAKELANLFSGNSGNKETKSHSFEVGKNYFIQTVTHYFSGRLVAVTDTDLVLEDAAWIADTGRFSDAMQAREKLSEVEPLPGRYVVCRGGLIGYCIPEWSELPREQKG